jgi:hypothetical protein
MDSNRTVLYRTRPATVTTERTVATTEVEQGHGDRSDVPRSSNARLGARMCP